MNNLDNDKEYLSKRGVAELLKKSVPTVNNYMKREGLPYYKVNRSVLFRRDEVDAWVEKYRK